MEALTLKGTWDESESQQQKINLFPLLHHHHHTQNFLSTDASLFV